MKKTNYLLSTLGIMTILVITASLPSFATNREIQENLYTQNMIVPREQGILAEPKSLALVDDNSVRNTFQNVYTVPKNVEQIPILYEIIIPKNLITSNDGNFYMYNETSSNPQEYSQKIIENTSPKYAIRDITSSRATSVLSDLNTETYLEYEINGSNQAIIGINYEQEVTSDRLVFDLPKNAINPSFVTIKTSDSNLGNSSGRIILNRVRVNSNRVNFPSTRSKNWIIEFEYNQPFRLSEIKFETKPENYSYSIKFLAQANEEYALYLNSTYQFVSEFAEKNRVYYYDNIESKVKLTLSNLQANYEFNQIDSDFDEVPDKKDNCSTYPNPDQVDLNENGIGDLCEDIDFDGRLSYEDNCPNISNPFQFDEDNDGKGNECDQEESRLPERYPFLPYAGIGISTLVILGLFYVVYKNSKKEEQGNTK